MSLAIRPPLRCNSTRTIGNCLRRISPQKLDRLDGKVAVVTPACRFTVIGCLDHHGVKTALLNQEVLVVLSPRRI
ncbi:hypothetical protein D3C84_883040 [compost metagenome]